MNHRLIVALLVSPLLLVGCGEPPPKPAPDPLEKNTESSKMAQVKELIAEDAPSWEGKDKALNTYIVNFCAVEDPATDFLDLPHTPKGVTEEDAGYVGGVLISSGACEK